MIMKIGIIGATTFDTDYLIYNLKSKVRHVEEHHIANAHIAEFRHLDFDIVVCTSGCGKVDSAAAISILLSKFQCSYVISIGSCGSLTTSLRPGALAIPKSIALYDWRKSKSNKPMKLTTSDFLRRKLQKACSKQCLLPSGLDCIAATGDTFINRRKQIKFFNIDKIHPAVVDMESGSIGQVCQAFQVPFAILRQVTNICDASAHSENKHKVSAQLSFVVLQFLESLSSSVISSERS